MYEPYVGEPDPVYAQRIMDEMCVLLGVRVHPRMVMGLGRDGHEAVYYEASRTISLSCARANYVDVIAHELQHHLDNIVGASLGGEKRGRHDSAFYFRLDETREELGLGRVMSAQQH